MILGAGRLELSLSVALNTESAEDTETEKRGI
jgi:hypothetical protein